MLVRLVKQKEGWDIVALSGVYYGQIIATAHVVNLTSARFHHDSLTGYLAAIRGFKIADFVRDVNVLKFLLKAKPGPTPDGKAKHCETTGKWFDVVTGTRLSIGIDELVVSGDNVFYRKVDKDVPKEDTTPTPTPTPTQPSTSPGLFSRLISFLRGK